MPKNGRMTQTFIQNVILSVMIIVYTVNIMGTCLWYCFCDTVLNEKNQNIKLSETRFKSCFLKTWKNGNMLNISRCSVIYFLWLPHRCFFTNASAITNQKALFTYFHSSPLPLDDPWEKVLSLSYHCILYSIVPDPV